MTKIRNILLSGLLCLLSACGTPNAVSDLTATTSKNMSQVSTELKKLSSREAGYAQDRIASLQIVEQTTAEGQSRLNSQLNAYKEAGASKTLSLFKKLQKAADDRLTEKARLNQERQARIAAINADVQKLSTQSESLSSLASALSALAKPETFKENVNTIIQVSSSVYEQLEEFKNAQEEAEKKAAETKSPTQ